MTGEADPSLRILIVAGEASGDILGARLMRQLTDLSEHPVCFSGVGGERMIEEGLTTLFPMRELSLMGVAEIVPKLPLLLRRIDETAQAALKQKPDIVVTIDSPDFSFRVARKIRRGHGPMPLMIHYVAPSVWAWRPRRAARVARLYDGLICLLPFEPPYFIAEGMDAVFAGHPAVERVADSFAGQAFRTAHTIPSDTYVLGVFFGSRSNEVERMGPVLRDSLFRILKGDTAPRSITVVAPTLPHLKDKVETFVRDLPCPVYIVTDEAEKWPGMAAMDSAIAVSGTIGLELAISRVPHVILYKMNALSWQIVKRNVKIRYAHLANILLDGEVVPECIQDRCTAAYVAGAAESLLDKDGQGATAQRAAFRTLLQKLSGSKNNAPPSEQAARYVLDLYKRVRG